MKIVVMQSVNTNDSSIQSPYVPLVMELQFIQCHQKQLSPDVCEQNAYSPNRHDL